MPSRLVEHYQIHKSMVCKEGMRIGGSKEDIEIGGLDNPVIRDPLTHLPYIPGSSLKGRMRFLLEYKEGKITPNGEPHGCQDPKCLICRVFGAHRITNLGAGPTRMIVRDAFLTEKSKKELTEKLGEKLYTELKQEVVIDRNTGKAAGAGPRTMERVPAGAEFDLNIVLRIFDTDNKDELVQFVEKGLQLLNDDSLGGAGSRGYGWVEIR